MKKCPYCAEEIQDEAIKCRYCGSMLDEPAPRDRFGKSSSDGIRLEASRVLNTEGKIQAIKVVREKKGLGLAQAKAYVEALEAGRDPDDAAKSIPEIRGGCFPLLVVVLVVIGGLIWWFSR